jgi:hypothetical protein
MKLSQLIESFVISNDEFVDYLDRATEQLAQEVQSGKNPRDAVHDLALQFANQHNKAYDAYVRMSDSLFARLHTLELDSSESTDLVPADMMNEPMSDMSAMNEPEMGAGDAMGGMDMNLPADDEMPSDSDMDDYNAVMDNEPEVEESMVEGEELEEYIRKNKFSKMTSTSKSNTKGVERFAIINDNDDIEVYNSKTKRLIRKVRMSNHQSAIQRLKKATYKSSLDTFKGYQMWYKSTEGGARFSDVDRELEEAHLAVDEGVKDVVKGAGTYARVSYEYSEDWGSIDLYKNHNKVAEWDGYFGANETGNPLARKFVEMCKEHGFDPLSLPLVDENGDIGKFDGKSFKWEDSVSEEDNTMGSITVKSDEERAGRAALANLRKIVDEKQARSIKFVDGSTKVDMFTASAIVKVYDAVNKTNKAKIINMLGTGKAGLLKVANAAMKLATTNEGVLGSLAKAAVPLAKGAARAAGAVVGGAVSTALDKTGSNQTAKAYSDLGKSLSYKKKPVKTESVEDKAAKIMESAINRAGKSKK